MTPLKPKHWLQVRELDGDVIAGPIRARQRWYEHFMHVFVAEPVQFPELLARAEDCRLEKFWQLSYQEVTMAPIKDPSMLSASFARLRVGKAAGEDRMVPEACRAAPGPFAQAYAGIFLKPSTRLEQPIQWRGSFIQELFKGKGDVAKCPHRNPHPVRGRRAHRGPGPRSGGSRRIAAGLRRGTHQGPSCHLPGGHLGHGAGVQ